MIKKRNNKRALYESIMKDVSKTVKRNLNENYKQSTAEILIDKIIDALTEDGTLESMNIFLKKKILRKNQVMQFLKKLKIFNIIQMIKFNYKI